MGQIIPTAGPLIYVQKDGEAIQVRRRGRYSIEYECALSEKHLEVAIHEAEVKMIEGIRRLGYEWVGDPFDFMGFERHIAFSASVDPDPGPKGRPDTNDVAALRLWEQAERARVARKPGSDEGLVDFVLVSTFRKPMKQGFTLSIPERR